MKLSKGLKKKIKQSKESIRCWHESWNGSCYISFSGGLDSTVLLHLVRSIFPDVPAMFLNTGIEYPEIVGFVRTKENVYEMRPSMSFRQVVEKYGYPVISKEQAYYIHQWRVTGSKKMKDLRWNGRSKDSQFKISEKWKALAKNKKIAVHDMCCEKLKKKPARRFEEATERKPFLGVRKEESSMRGLRKSCNIYDSKHPTSNPLSFWTSNDVIEYIVKKEIPYCSVYGEIKKDDEGKYYTTGEERTGCMFCLFGVHLDKGENRFQRMSRTHPQHYKVAMERFQIKEILNFIDVPYK